MIEYIKLFWEGAPEGEPSVILYEVDTENERLALRSIDIFADGRTRNIPDLYDGAIEITPIPTVEELNAHVWGEEFHACIIEQAEFEAIWEEILYWSVFLRGKNDRGKNLCFGPMGEPNPKKQHNPTPPRLYHRGGENIWGFR